jgi:hypothetical protein
MRAILLRWIHNPEISAGRNGEALAAVTQSDVFKYHINKNENWAISGPFQRQFRQCPVTCFLREASTSELCPAISRSD